MIKFEGLIAAPFTPMNEWGEVIPEMIPEYFSFLEKNGVAGVFVNGSTGEGVSMSQRERQLTTEAWVAAAKNSQVKVITLVGGTSYTESIENALHAYSAGVDAIAVMAPFCFKPDGAVQLAEFIAAIAESVPDLPVYFYHIPVLTGCYVSMFDLLNVAKDIPNLAGIKYTHEDFMDYQSCMGLQDGHYDMLWGRDENFLAAMSLGARAAVGSTFNYAAPLYLKMKQRFDAGDLVQARQLQMQSINMIRLLSKYGGIATGKAYMRYLGFDFGGFRSPVKNMTQEDFSRFTKDVKGLKMEDLFSVK